MYDFTTVKNRRLNGASKWTGMKKADGTPVREDIVPLSVADMEFVNAPEIVAAMHRCADEMTPYGYQNVTEGYLDAVVYWMKHRHQWTIDPEWIVISQGVVKALNQAVKAFTKPGEGVVIMTPVYYPFYSAAACNGTHVVENPLILCEDHYEIDFEDLKQKLADPMNTMLILCTPHNPIGKVFSYEELKQIGELALKYGVLIVADEIHNDLIMPGFTHTMFPTIDKAFEENCIVCTSPSKTFNLAGMSNANIIIPNQVLREQYLKDAGFIHINPFALASCVAAYREGEAWLSALIEVLSENVRFMNEYIKQYFPKAIVHELQGTYLLWVDFRAYGLNKDELEHLMREEADLFLDEGYLFGKAGEGFERINLAVPTQILKDAMARMRQVFIKHNLIEAE